MRTLKFTFLLLVSGIVAHPAHAQLGDAIRKAQNNASKAKRVANIYTPWSAEQERVIGEASAAKLINIFGLYENADMVKYVNLVGGTVARQAGRNVPYHFAILDTEVVTAVSLPGGFVFITRGALANIHSESELAGTLAHEVAHIDRRHLEKEIRSQKASQFAKEETASRIPQGAELVNLSGEVIRNALTLQVSRDKETEADQVGLDLSAKAGYDAAGLRNFLQFLSQVPASGENRKQLGLWGSTHPPFNERVATLNSLLAKYPNNGQQLQDRYSWYVNPLNFSKAIQATAAAAPTRAPSAGGAELDGIVSGGMIVLQGGRLAEGTKVKIRVVD
ncbi:MAG TPA: M48 family metalloprotease [Candidatus Saccharimonadales bacterium]|nr:M48 family metalloprotease [Candidatus Saccharimonadales bacterium]